MLWFGLLLALGVTVTALKGNAPFEREKEVYHIYSLLMTIPRSSFGADCNSRFLISATARAENEQPCVRPPKGRKAEFAEVLADFKIRKAATRVLKRQLSLRKPYELLTDEQVKAFETDRGWSKPKDREPDPRFKGVMEVFTLSDVYFSKNGRLALTAISSWCGSLCAYHQWKVLEKLPTGEWQELPSWVSCFTIAHCLQHALTPAGEILSCRRTRGGPRVCSGGRAVGNREVRIPLRTAAAAPQLPGYRP